MTQQINYNTLLNEIAKLQQQAESFRKQETQSIIENIQKQMSDYGLSPQDLKVASAVQPDKSKTVVSGEAMVESEKEKKTRRKAIPKFKDPVSGVTWSGRGRMPKWIEAAINQGKHKEDFALAQG